MIETVIIVLALLAAFRSGVIYVNWRYLGKLTIGNELAKAAMSRGMGAVPELLAPEDQPAGEERFERCTICGAHKLVKTGLIAQ